MSPKMNTVRRLAQNSISSLVATLSLRLSSAVLFIVVARKLGEEAAGAYALATTYTLISLSLSFWGLDQLFVRDVSQDRRLAEKYWINLGLLRLLLASAAIALLYGFLLALGKYPPDTIKLIMLMGLTLIPDGVDNICQAYFMAIEEMYYIPLGSLTLALFRLVGVAVVGWYGNVAVVTVVWVFLAASIARCLTSSWLVLKRMAPITLDFDPTLWLQSIVWAFPFVFINVFVALEARLGTILISLLGTEREVGLYGAAMTAVVALQMIPQAFREAVFPTMSRLHAHNTNSFQSLYRQSFFYLLVTSLGLVPCVIIMAPDLMVFLYEQPFAPAKLSLQILALSIVFRLLNIPSSRLMIINDRQGWLALFLGLGLAGNLIVSLCLIPRLGFEMAAAGQVVSMLVFFLANSLFVYRNILKIKVVPLAVRPLIALGASLGIAFLLLEYTSLSLPIIALASLVSYVGVLIATKAFPQEDVQSFKQILRIRV
jgi:O-antigen/teichoic acid export membrane protein